MWAVFSMRFLDQGILWDLGIYEKAVLIFNSGGNAFDPSFYMSTLSPGVGHLFIYQPLVLRGMALFGQHLGLVMILVYTGSLLFFFKNLGNRRAWWFASFFAFFSEVFVVFFLIFFGFGDFLGFREKVSEISATKIFGFV